MSMMVSFVLSFFPRDVLDEILNLIESVSEDFPSYSFLGRNRPLGYYIFYRNMNTNLSYFIKNHMHITHKQDDSQLALTKYTSSSHICIS